MTGLFQALGDFLDYLLSPIYGIILYLVNYLYRYLLGILQSVCGLISQILSTYCKVFAWCFDRIFVNSLNAIHSVFPNGLFNGLESSGTTFGTLITNGFVGLSWVQNYIPVGALVTPFLTYITFYFSWTVYKLIKSWIPTVSGS